MHEDIFAGGVTLEQRRFFTKKNCKKKLLNRLIFYYFLTYFFLLGIKVKNLSMQLTYNNSF